MHILGCISNSANFEDLVFYHIVLKRYVLIDLKVGKVKHSDIGQMNLYLGYYTIDMNKEKISLQIQNCKEIFQLNIQNLIQKVFQAWVFRIFKELIGCAVF